jgi:hypothetical protein
VTDHRLVAQYKRRPLCRRLWLFVSPPTERSACRAALKSRTCLKDDDELLQINPGFRKRIMHLDPGLGTRQNEEEEGADSGVNETVET